MTEPIGKLVDNKNHQQSPRKKRTIELLQLYQYVCRLSQTTTIRLATAINVAIHYGYNIELIQEMKRNGDGYIPLNIFYVADDEPIRQIPNCRYVFPGDYFDSKEDILLDNESVGTDIV